MVACSNLLDSLNWIIGPQQCTSRIDNGTYPAFHSSPLISPTMDFTPGVKHFPFNMQCTQLFPDMCVVGPPVCPPFLPEMQVCNIFAFKAWPSHIIGLHSSKPHSRVSRCSVPRAASWPPSTHYCGLPVDFSAPMVMIDQKRKSSSCLALPVHGCPGVAMGVPILLVSEPSWRKSSLLNSFWTLAWLHFEAFLKLDQVGDHVNDSLYWFLMDLLRMIRFKLLKNLLT